MAADADALAADIICSLRGADLAGWTPPWCKPPLTSGEGELIWPAMARGKRSRRRSPVAAAAAGKGRWARASPASPLDYSGGSGASTSGGEDGGSPGDRRAGHAPATKGSCVAGSQWPGLGRPHLTFPAPPPQPTGQRPRKKMRLPEVQQLVRSLAVENEILREEMRALQRACTALSKENDKLETRLEQSNLQNETASKERKGKQQLDQQSPQDSFVLPDLNLPAQDVADGSVH